MSKVTIIIFVALIALISSKAQFIVHSHSGSWCDYWTGLGLVNIQVIQKGLSHSRNVTFNMTVQDYNRNKYFANCTIEQTEAESGQITEDKGDTIEETEDTVPRAYCYFDPPILSADLTYKNDTLNFSSNNEIVVKDDFYIIAQKCESKAEAEKKSDLHLSFKQISTFKQVDTLITFFFYGLTTKQLDEKFEIIINIYLYLEGGVKEKDPRPAKCKIIKAVNPKKLGSIQAPFKCSIDGLERRYHTIKFSSSNDIAGVPFENETLLDPKLTDEEIKKKTLPNCTEPEEEKVTPTVINVENITSETCETQGDFIIRANLSENVDEEVILNVPAAYPIGVESTCIIPKGNAGELVIIRCKYNNDTENQPLILEQRIVKFKVKQFLFSNAKSKEMTCRDSDLVSAEKKFNSSLSFRQVSGFEYNKNESKITFNFTGLTTETMVENTTIDLYVFLITEDDKLDSILTKATCLLNETVNVNKTSEETQAQADFICEITGLDPNKNYKSLELNSSDFIVGIPNNKTLLDPVKTDEAIKDNKLPDHRKNKFLLPIKFTPKLTKPVDASICSEKGEFIIVGDIDKEIQKPIEFKLPIIYPEAFFAKCNLEKTPKGKAELKCKMDKKLMRKGIIIEQQILRDDKDEILTLGKIQSEKEIYCNIPPGPANKTDLPVVLPREGELLDDAKKRVDIKITFRQITEFKATAGEITVFLFVLVTEKPKKDIKIKVNLIKENGEIEDETREINCTLEDENIKPEEGKTLQGVYKCTRSNLPGTYYSLRLNSSDSVAGIPKDEVLLDPILTAKAIENKKIKSCRGNKGELPIFKFEKIESNKIFIKGIPLKPIERDFKFTVPLEFPEGASMFCSLTKKEGEVHIFTCLTDMEIKNKPLIIERTIIKEGPEEIMHLERVYPEGNITCNNGLLEEAKIIIKKKISFRQVSRLRKDKPNNKFKFFLASLISKEKVPKDTILILKIFVLIDGVKKEKNATCVLEKEVDPKDTQVQGDFNCEVILSGEEFDKIDFEKNESVLISPYNEEITGVSELNETDLSPLATEIEINETKKIQKDPKVMQTDLATCIDYFVEENKKKIPPTFEIDNIEDNFVCRKSGKFNIKGHFSAPIEKEMSFMLPLAFPSSKVKCKVHEAKSGEKVDMVCKVQKEFRLARSIAVEDRLLKTRHKEMFFVKNHLKEFKLPMECGNHNTLKMEKVKKRFNAKISFLQVLKYEIVLKKIQFYLGLFRFEKAQPFTPKPIPIRIRVGESSDSSQNEPIFEELTANCTLEEQSDNAGRLKCISNEEIEGNPTNLKIITDYIEDISGMPDDADPSLLNYKIIYSDKEKLQLIDDLPTVEITEINSEESENTGSYTIIGKTDKKLECSNVEIPFSSPDSCGLCNITTDDNKKVTMKCHNKEEFEASPIIFEPTLIQIKDEDKKIKEVFKLKKYINKDKFACITSVNSSEIQVPKITEDTTEEQTEAPNNNNDNNDNNNNDKNSTIDETPDDETKNYYPTKKKNSKRLTGGAIAAIVICCVVVVAIVAVLLCMVMSSKGGVAATPSLQSVANINNNSSSLNNVSYEPKPSQI